MPSTARSVDDSMHRVKSPRAGKCADFKHRSVLHAAVLLGWGTLFSCGGVPPVANPPTQHALVSTPQGSIGQIEVRHLHERPRLTLVSRDGDPSPALVATVATDLDSVATTALASIVESRLKAGGFDVDLRIHRNAFCIRMFVQSPDRIAPFLNALATAFTQPIVAKSADVAYAAQRIQALRYHVLDAPELLPIAACTGQLGLTPSDPNLDLTTPSGVQALDASRRTTLHAGRTSIAAVGPAAFCVEAARSLEGASAWVQGAAPTDNWPREDSVGVFISNQVAPQSARLTVAVRVANAQAASAAAMRLGTPDSPLQARLAALPYPWRTAEVLGVARPRGGCLSVTADAKTLSDAQPVEESVAFVANLVRHQMSIELGGPASSQTAARQILTASDPREAAERASWWAFSSVATNQPERWATALALPPKKAVPAAPDDKPTKARFQAALGNIMATNASTSLEQKVAIERGQGQVWMLLASTCGAQEEGTQDAGSTALAVLAAVQTRRADADVQLEPWITPDGIGIIAHATFANDKEMPVELGRRVAGALARTLMGTRVESDQLSVARASVLQHLQQNMVQQPVVQEALLTAISPGHPSSMEPLGLWNRVASTPLQTVQSRWQALQTGPLRLAIVANADKIQAAAAAGVVESWFTPRITSRPCDPLGPGVAQAGQYDVRLPKTSRLTQGVVGVLAGKGATSRQWAHLTAAALDGKDGLLARALAAPKPGGSDSGSSANGSSNSPQASVRVAGGLGSSALIVEIQALPEEDLHSSVVLVTNMLTNLSKQVTEADLARARNRIVAMEKTAQADPRQRLVSLWLGSGSVLDSGISGKGAGGPQPLTVTAWRDWMDRVFKQDALVVVEARPEGS